MSIVIFFFLEKTRKKIESEEFFLRRKNEVAASSKHEAGSFQVFRNGGMKRHRIFGGDEVVICVIIFSLEDFKRRLICSEIFTAIPLRQRVREKERERERVFSNERVHRGNEEDDALLA